MQVREKNAQTSAASEATEQKNRKALQGYNKSISYFKGSLLAYKED